MEVLTLFGLGASLTTGLIIILAWGIVWKGWALWIAARRQEKWWFIVLLILNTFAVLEIIYLFLITKEGQKFFSKLKSKK